MVKLAANAYLATRISFINEIANVCELVGADVEDVARGMGLDRRIGTHYLRAGLGYGGSCFPKDISFLKLLAGNSGYHFHLVTAVIEVNDLQMRRPVAKLQKHLGSLRGKRIALLGLAFKANTDDMREAPSIVLAARLLAEGAEVVAWDPVADARSLLHGVTFVDSVASALAGADAAVVVTEWPELRDLPLGGAQDHDALTGGGRRAQPPGRRRDARRRLRVRGDGALRLSVRDAAGDARAGAHALPGLEENDDGGDRPGGRKGRAHGRRDGRPAEGARRRRREAADRVSDRPARERRRGPRDRLVCRRPGRGLPRRAR